MNSLKLSNLIFILISVLLVLASAREYKNHKMDEYTEKSPVISRRHKKQPDYMRTGGVRWDRPKNRRQDAYAESNGPVHTFVKTDEHAHFKWGVHHHMG